MRSIYEILKVNSYPGRGIVFGRLSEGETAVIAYFTMGRSENSRNRIFIPEGGGLRILPFDASKLEDPSLVIYDPVRISGGRTVVTNGDQTDTICEHLAAKGSLMSAMKTREFEPDASYTPRISGIINPEGSYTLSIVKSNDGNSDSCLRFYFEYDSPVPGEGHFISTYKQDGTPLPSFEGEPIKVAIGSDFKGFAYRLWDSLDFENKVSLFARSVSLSGGDTETIIFNKREGD